ncbi:MAG: C45 family peptidase [Bacteroidales bacterium]|nr:C45 family peptidase [Bacteroidales bacterium]
MRKSKKIRARRRKKVLLILGTLFCLLVIWFMMAIKVESPINDQQTYNQLKEMVNVTDSGTFIGKSWLRESAPGTWEMYLEGSPYEMGCINGILTADQVKDQEEYFVGQLDYFIPKKFYQNVMYTLVRFFNRKLDKYIPEEYKLEIAGVSNSASEDYNHYAKPYARLLNYHAAHDIGHAVQAYNLVGCSALTMWGDKADSNNLIHGRNFDFYLNDDFAKDKIIAFFNPEKGYSFASVTWGGFIGAVSGMNEMGLAVTINAAQTELPRRTATPISILIREILQYAQNIEEAVAIAEKTKTFVSESILISSAVDSSSVIIEKTATRMKVVQPDSNMFLLTNHYRAIDSTFPDISSEKFNDSHYRYLKLEELTADIPEMDLTKMVKILRDYEGLKGENLGLGNYNALNQFICHHSIIFSPYKRSLWVSTYPFNINTFNGYDLGNVFNTSTTGNPSVQTEFDGEVIEADSVLYSPQFKLFRQFRELRFTIEKSIQSGKQVENSVLDSFRKSSSDYYLTYQILGNYYAAFNQPTEALNAYTIALDKKIPDVKTRNEIMELIEDTKKELE